MTGCRLAHPLGTETRTDPEGRSSAGFGGSAERAQDVFERRGEQLLCRLAGGLAAQPASVSRRGSGRSSTPARSAAGASPGRCRRGRSRAARRRGLGGRRRRVSPRGRRCPRRVRSCRGRSVRFASVQSSQRDTVSATRARALRPSGGRSASSRRASEPFEQRDVDLRASAEVVVHQAARDTCRAGDVLDRDLFVATLGEQVVGRVEHLFAPLRGVEAAVLPRRAHQSSVPGIGDPTRDG